MNVRKGATDVFTVEPLPKNNPARRVEKRYGEARNTSAIKTTRTPLPERTSPEK